MRNDSGATRLTRMGLDPSGQFGLKAIRHGAAIADAGWIGRECMNHDHSPEERAIRNQIAGVVVVPSWPATWRPKHVHLTG